MLVVLALSVTAFPQESQTSGNQDEWQAAWGNLQSAFRNVGSWFTRQYSTVQGWFATSRQELEQKVQNMVTFLDEIKANATAAAQGAGQQVQASLQNVNNYYQDVVQFQNKLRSDAATSFQSLEAEWQNKVQTMYNGGLDKIVNAAQTAKTEVRQPTADTGK